MAGVSNRLKAVFRAEPWARASALLGYRRDWRATGGRRYEKRRMRELRGTYRREIDECRPYLHALKHRPDIVAGSILDSAHARYSIVVLPQPRDRSRSGEAVGAAFQPADTPSSRRVVQRRPAVLVRSALRDFIRNVLERELVFGLDRTPAAHVASGLSAAAAFRPPMHADPLTGLDAMIVRDLSTDDRARLLRSGARVIPNGKVAIPTVGRAASAVGDAVQSRPGDLWHLESLGLVDEHGRRPALSGFDPDSVVVGIVDTGVDADHPELAGCVRWLGRTDNRIGSARDDHGHGTHIAALVTGRTVGVAPGVTLAVVGALIGPNGTGTLVDVGRAINWILNDPVTGDRQLILNLSLQTSALDPDALRDFADAIEVAAIVAAAGNDGGGLNRGAFPARLEGVIAVGATDREERVAWFSAVAPSHRSVDCIKPEIYAPGLDVWSAAPGGSFVQGSGTSLSTAIASGLLALYVGQGRLSAPDGQIVPGAPLQILNAGGVPVIYGPRETALRAPARRRVRYDARSEDPAVW